MPFYDWSGFSRASIGGLLTFAIIHQLLSKIILSNNEKERWKQINIATSFLHSFISSIVVISCFLENPAMCTTDIISSFTPRAYLFICFEIGYFFFDSIDMLRKGSGRQTYEILLHHFIIVICFGISVYLGKYIGYAVLSLFLEINSVFLHLRQLLLMWHRSRRELIFRLNNLLNMGTFLIFRFGVLTYMSIWLIFNRHHVPVSLVFIGQTGLLLMMIINISLFSRLLKSDFSSRKINA